MALYYEQILMQPAESFRLLRWSRNVSAVEHIAAGGTATTVDGAGESWHYHPEIELTFVESGSGTRFVGDHLARFRAPDLVLLGTNLPHYWRGLDPSTGLALQFDPHAPAFDTLPELEHLRPLLNKARQGLRLRGATRTAVERLLRSMQNAPALRRLALLWELLAVLSDTPSCDSEMLAQGDFSHIGDSAYQTQMELAVRWILDRSAQSDLRLPDLLHTIGMSRPTFSRQFPRHTGYTFSGFICAVRLNQACHALITSRRPVAEIAYACGFETLSHFNRQFRQHTGLTPTAFRTNGTYSTSRL